MTTIKTEANQTVFDMAVQHYGTTEAVAEIMSLNTLVNDPHALADAGIDTSEVFYPDIALKTGLTVVIDDNSALRNRNTLKELDSRTITTYDNGKDSF